MIDNFSNMLPSILNMLDNSAFTFYPTGSRYFGGKVEASSDWDFIVEDDHLVRTFLIDHGFVVDTDAGYDADETVAIVYSYRGSLSGDKGLTKIDVQVVHPNHLSTKLLIQKLLKGRFGERGLPGDKSVRSEIWHLMFHSLKTLNIAH